jgi:hypothetical protein
VISRFLLILGGLSLAVLLVEAGLRIGDFGVAERSAGAYRRMHYVYTETGLGKCYPTDPRGYFPYDLRRTDDLARLGAIVTDVTDLPDDWTTDEKVRFLSENAPHCNNIELVPLNSGPDPERSGKVLIIGDSFAFGEGLRIEDTIGYAMADRFPDVNFANMAWPGTSINTIFDVEGTPDDVDTVLYFYNINDLSRTEELKQRRDMLHDTIRSSEQYWRTPAVPGPCGWLKTCRLVRYRDWEMRRSQATVEYFHEIYFGAENAEPRAATFDRIAAMEQILSARNIRFVVAMFPLYYKAPLAAYPLERIHRLVAEEVHERGVEFIDLLPAFQRYPWWHRFTVHPLDRHPSRRAIRLTADYLQGELHLEDG